MGINSVTVRSLSYSCGLQSAGTVAPRDCCYEFHDFCGSWALVTPHKCPALSGKSPPMGAKPPPLRSGTGAVPNIRAAAEEKNQFLKEIWCSQRHLLWESCVEVIFFPFCEWMNWRKMDDLCFLFPTLPPPLVNPGSKTDLFILYWFLKMLLVEFSHSCLGLEFRRVFFNGRI